MKRSAFLAKMAGVLATALVAGALAIFASSPLVAADSTPTIAVATDAKLGKILVDGKGMTLYMYTKDTKDTSNCYGGCAAAWPPLLVTDKPMLGGDVMASLVSTTKRTDGTMQVTYAGWPLYYWKNDKAAGDTTGQDVGHVWYVVAPDGTIVKPTM